MIIYNEEKLTDTEIFRSAVSLMQVRDMARVFDYLVKAWWRGNKLRQPYPC